MSLLHCPKRLKNRIGFFIFISLFLTLSLGILLSDVTYAQTSDKINLQGKIVRNDTGYEGLNVTEGSPACVSSGADTCDFQVKYYDASTAGTLLYTETFSDIEIGDYKGVFNLYLGSVSGSGLYSSISDLLANESTVYLQIEFAPGGAGSFTEVFSRTQLNASAYAIKSKYSQFAEGSIDDAFKFFTASSTTGLTSTTGSVYYDTTDGLLKVYNGSGWDAVGGSPSLWTDGGTFSYLTSTTDDLVLGGDSLATSKFFFDVSEGRLGIGTSTPTSAIEIAGASSSISNDTGDITISPAGNLIVNQGNVGIGTTVPASKLDVRDSTLGDNESLAYFLGSNSGNTAGLSIRNYSMGADDDRIGLYWQHENVSNVRMWMGDTGYLYSSPLTPTSGNDGRRFIQEDATGKVGIGTTAPSYTLDVNGDARISTLASGSTNTVVTHSSGLLQTRTIDSRAWEGGGLVDGSGTTNYVARWTDSNTLGIGTLYDNGTNVGIGTTNPIGLLDLYSATGSTLRLTADVNDAEVGALDFLEGTTAFGTTGSYGARIQYQGVDNKLYFMTANQGAVNTRMTIERDTGYVGIGTTAPTEILEVNGNLKFSNAATILAGGALEIGDGTDGVNINSSGTVTFSKAVNVTGDISSTTGVNVGGVEIVSETGNISGDRLSEIVEARTTYTTLNDRLNGIVTNYSSVMSNADTFGDTFTTATNVNTSNTSAYFNSQIGSIQNDHSSWQAIPETVYGNSRTMGNAVISGNKMYIATYSYGVKILNLDTEAYEGDWYESSTPALPEGDTLNGIAHDPVRNDIYVGAYGGSAGLMKIDVDANTITSYTTSNSNILNNYFGESYTGSFHYYNGKLYFFPANNYMQVFDVVNETFTNYGSTSGLPSDGYYSVEGNGNELHISTSSGFYIWNMDTDTLTQSYTAGGSPGLHSYTNTIYSSHQDPSDPDIVWIGSYRSWQKLSKTTGYLEFHRTDEETGAYNTRWNISRIGDQIWLASYYGHAPYGYMVYDLNAEDYFVISDTGKVVGNEEYTSSYHGKPLYYNGYYYFNFYSSGYIAKSQLIYETSNTFETNTIINTTQNITTAKFKYAGGVGTGNSITWYISANGGVNWEGPVSPGALWEFTNIGTDLRVKAEMTAGTGTTPIIRSISAVAYDGATWAGEGSTTVETEVLQARDSSTFGVFGSLDLRLEDIDTRLQQKIEGSHNHDERYLQLTGGTLSGQLNMGGHIIPTTDSAYNLGSSTNYWANTFTDNLYTTGDVGIGTTNPTEKLSLTSSGASDVFGIHFKETDLDNYGAKILYDNGNDVLNIVGYENGIQQLGLSVKRTNGNIGIGTTSPSYKLDVNGQVRVSTLNAGSTDTVVTHNAGVLETRTIDSRAWDGGGLVDGSGTTNYVARWTDADTLGIGTLYDNGTNVGIGTTSPTSKLNIDGTGSLLDITSGGTSLFTVTDTQITSNLPHAFTSSGDVSMAYNLYMTNQTSSKIESYGPLSIVAGEPYESNNLTLKTYNSGRLLVESSNFWVDYDSVGIGTTTPSYALDVSDGTGIVGRFSGRVIGGDAVNTNEFVTLGQVESSQTGMPTGSTGQTLRHDGAEWVANSTLYNNGTNVGIGTASPEAKLDVAGGNIWMDSGYYIGTNVNNNLLFNGGSPKLSGATALILNYDVIDGGGNFYIASGSAGTSRLVVDSTGKVGIGTATPSALFQVEGGNAIFDVSPSNDYDIALDSSTLAAGANISANTTFNIGTSSINSMRFFSSDTERMTISSDGDVGIGTTSPASLLDVDGRAWVDNIFLSNSRTLNAYGQPEVADGISGILSFGANTNDKAQIFSTVSGASTGLIFYIADDSQDYFEFQNGTDSLVRLTYGGDLGIGTTSPSAKLDVSGGTAKINNTMWGISIEETAPASTMYYKIATLPVSTNSTRDHIVINGVFGGWTSNSKAEFNIFMSNRNAYEYKYDLYGDVRTDARIVAFEEADGSISVYSYHAASSYTATTLNINQSTNATVYPNPSGSSTTPSGTLVFDSSSSSYSPRFVINNAGSVGIGTTSPAGKLNISETTGTVHGAAQGSLILDHENSGGASSIVFRSKVNRGSDYGYIQYQDTDTVGGAGETARLIIGTSNDTNDHLILQPTGDVGIGTTSPSYKLDVNGTTNISSSLYLSGNERFNTSGALVPHTVSSTTKFTNLNADLLDGFNTSTAATASTVAVRDGSGDIYQRYGYGSYFSMSHSSTTRNSDTVFYSSTDNYIRKNDASGMRSSLGLISGGAGDIWVEKGGDTMTGTLTFSGVTTDITTVSNQHLALMPNGTGNVGIGTSSPSEKLDVEGNISMSGLLFGDISSQRNLIANNVYETSVAGYKHTNGKSLVSVTNNRFNFSRESTYTSDYARVITDGYYSLSFWYKVENYVSGTTMNVDINDQVLSGFDISSNKGWTFYSDTKYITTNTYGFIDLAATFDADITISDMVLVRSPKPSQQHMPAPEDIVQYSPNDYVGIGTTSPSYALDVVSGDSIAARFDGRVIGSDGVNSNEFVTKSQLDGVAGNETITLTGSVTGSGTTSIATTLQDHISYDVIAGNGNGLKFWGGSDSYKIHMGNSVNHQYGPVTDYSIKTNMNSTAGRGWTWGVVDTAPIAALSNAGVMQIASNFYSLGKVGIGTTSPGADLEVGTTTEASNSIIRALSADAYTQGFEAYGNSQGSGYLYVGQSSAYGGGMFYNGDGTPASGTSTDHISIYRRTGGVDTEVLHWLHSSSTAFFEGNVDLQNNGLVDVNWAASDDGSGSGLDADLLDGLDSTDFMSATEDLWVNENGDTMSGTLNMGTNSINGIFSAQFSNSVTTSHTGDNQGRLIFDSSEGFQFYESAGLGNRTGTGWATIWDSNNDGSGSGLDADLLDGVHASNFLQTESLYYYNADVGAVENVSPQYWILTRNAGSNDVNGQIRIDRTSGNYQAAVLDIIVTSTTTSVVGGSLETNQSTQSNEQYRLVTLTLTADGNSYVAIEYTGNTYPKTTSKFTGHLRTSGGNTFTAVTAADVSSVQALSTTNSKHTFTGKMGVGTTNPDAKLDIVGGSDEVQLQVKGNATQTSNILQIDKSDDSILMSVANSGLLTLAGNFEAGTTNSYDVGSSTKRWKDVYTQGTIQVGANGDSGSIRYNTTDDQLEFSNDGTNWIALGDKTKSITLSAEYAGAVMSADGTNNTGFMTSDAEGTAYDSMNYYEWYSSETTLQDYDIRVRFTIPSDFESWGTNAFTFNYATEANASTNNKVDFYIYEEGTGTVDGSSVGQYSTTAGVWTTTSVAGSGLTDCNVAGETCVVIMRMYSANDSYVRVGDIDINYNREL